MRRLPSNPPKGEYTISPMATPRDINAEWHHIISPMATPRDINAEWHHIISPMATPRVINAECHHIISPMATPRVYNVMYIAFVGRRRPFCVENHRALPMA